MPGYAGHLMNMHDVGVGQTFGEGSSRRSAPRERGLGADDRARASDRVEIGGLPVGGPREPGGERAALYPEFEANLRLRHGPGALVCGALRRRRPEPHPPDSPGSRRRRCAVWPRAREPTITCS